MKKLLAIAIVLTVGFSACSFDPIPEPIKGWVYVQPFYEFTDDDGDFHRIPLCDLAHNYSPFAQTVGIAALAFVDGYLNAPVDVEEETETLEIFIESTLPDWTIIDFKDVLASGYNITYSPSGDEVIIDNGTDDVLRLSWNVSTFTIVYNPPAFYSFDLPRFSGVITVEKLDLDIPLTGALLNFYIEAVNHTGIGNSPCYTGFALNFL